MPGFFLLEKAGAGPYLGCVKTPRAIILSLSLPGLLLLSNCHRKSVAAAALTTPAGSTTPRMLRFGSGGGFAGTTISYTLYADGRLERRRGAPADTSQAVSRLTSAPAGPVSRCFQALDALPADSLTLREPGNLYYFLEGQTTAGRTVALTWGAVGARVPRGATALYRDLVSLVPLSD